MQIKKGHTGRLDSHHACLQNFGFIELNDGSFFKNIQIVFEAERLKNYEEISKQNVGAALIIKGLLVETPRSKAALRGKGNTD